MQCGLISLAALITVASAQMLTIDNNINTPTNATTKEKFEDRKNSSLDVTNISTSTAGPLSGNSDINEDLPSEYSNSRPDSRPTRESSESDSNEKSKSKENNSNQYPKSNESSSKDTPKSREDGPVKQSSEDVSRVKPGEESREPNNNDSKSNETPGGEVFSQEKPDEVKPGVSVSRSASVGDTDSAPRSDEASLLVQTAHGTVKGHMWRDTSDIIGYIDIPYGKINGSFEAPVPTDWSNVHEITEHTKRCPQYHNDEYVGDKDCLTLSIFSPKEANNISVLFHIHDSYSGSKSADPLIYGPEYLVPKGVILVLPNYRVGPMGFLCMQNETAPGNAGLKDLTLALAWVRENIHAFGGNPANIVVSGYGTAGAYAGYLALASRSKYYVNKVITDSGSPLSHWALDRTPIAKAYELAEKIRSEHPNEEFNNIFEEAALDIIIKAAREMSFNPCIERDKEPFMEITPWRMLHDKEIDNTFMIGSASYAGAHEAVGTSLDLIEEFNTNFSQFLPADLLFDNDAERITFAEKLRAQYFNETITSTHAEELSLWYTDASYWSPGVRLARPLLKAGAMVYLYEFAFVGVLNRELEALNNYVPGAVRGDIVGYLFRKNDTTVEDGSPEKHMIDVMVDLWASFINTGKPTAENIEWNEFKQTEESEEEWLLIDSDPKPMRGIHVDRLRLWTSLYEEHFIEHSSALRLAARHCLTLAAALAWLTIN